MFCHLLIYLCVNVFKKIFLTVTDKICGTFMVLGIFNRRDNDMQLGQLVLEKDKELYRHLLFNNNNLKLLIKSVYQFDLSLKVLKILAL